MLGHTARTPVAAAATVAGTLLLAAGCGWAPSGDQSPGSAAPATTTATAEPADATARATAESAGSSAAPPELTRVDPSAVSVPGSPGAYAWNYSVGGRAGGLCVSGGDGVTCTGTAAASVPDLTQMFPGRPGAIELGPAGLRYTFVEGIPPVPGRLGAGQYVEIGGFRCAIPDGSALRCGYGGNSFAISGPDLAITTSGTLLDERDSSNHDSASSGHSSSSDQPSGFMGASGLVSGVRTSSGRLVTASAPPCDGRGILVLDSYVESAQPQQGIADLLDRHPGAEFATPGQCPSLRSQLDGARVYPIYTDHGHDTAALCRDKAARGGTARLLTTTPEHLDPC